MSEYKLSILDGVIRVNDNKFIPADDNNLEWLQFREWLKSGGVPEPPEDDKPIEKWDDFRDAIMQDTGYNRIRIAMLTGPAQLYGSRLEAAASRARKDVHLPTIRNIWNQMMQAARGAQIGPSTGEVHVWNQLAIANNMPLRFDTDGSIKLD